VAEYTSNTAGISQYKPIQSAKYCNLIGWLRATELDYIVKCPQCKRVSKCHSAKYRDMGIAYMVIVLLIRIGAAV
jgi:phage FluMu protein Com